MVKKVIMVLLFLMPVMAFFQNNYSMNKTNSQLTFTSTHIGVTRVPGQFKDFEATLKSAKDDFTDAMITMTAEAKSIGTKEEKRDDDLKSAKYMEVEKFPKIEFKSTAFKKINDKNYKLEGNITIHGVTKPIVFDVVYTGKTLRTGADKNSVGFIVTGKLNRKDFGVGTGGMEKVVGKEIELRSNVEFMIN